MTPLTDTNILDIEYETLRLAEILMLCPDKSIPQQTQLHNSAKIELYKIIEKNNQALLLENQEQKERIELINAEMTAFLKAVENDKIDDFLTTKLAKT